MKTFANLLLLCIAMLGSATAYGQSCNADDIDLKLAALEALMTAPSDRALPIVEKVLRSNNCAEVKSRALFVLSQLDMTEAQQILLETARNSEGELQMDALRMIGIGGDPATIAQLGDIYSTGSPEVRESILHAFMIAGDTEAVYQVAANAQSDEEFEIAVQFLATMGATEELSRLRGREGASESLIHAYAVSGDVESLRVMALNADDPEIQMQAIHGLGIAGGDDVNETLMEIYRNSDDMEVREAVMHGLMVSGYDQGVLELYRSTDNKEEKKELLRLLVIMDSDAAMEVIDEALGSSE